MKTSKEYYVHTYTQPSRPQITSNPQIIDWVPEKAILALGNPKIYGKENNDKLVRYPESGTSTLVFPKGDPHFDFPGTRLPDTAVLKDMMFWIKTKNRIFIVPHVVTGKYTCEIIASRKDGLPGKATITLYTDAIVENNEPQWFKGDSNVMESKLLDLCYEVSCEGTGFSWQRKPEEQVQFENNWENGVPLIIMQDSQDMQNVIYSLVLWSAPVDLNPNFKDPAILLPNE
ncbi:MULTISPECIES: hypothetical protein [Photorhabdus]|uniref:Uncharacterized protein n=1 Tax=Photorhabdus thracensis TaxID=230089 RepID=A0A0F7LP01_9GAMM|nr:hypothetical protein [Photorhabdus thracensis]AKH63517.1 hypothetical protein VY86_09355 [Photorhabdus thracensis]